MICEMKRKISITLSEELLVAMSQFSRFHKNRSDFIESAVRHFIACLNRTEQNSRDLDMINQYADELNAEAEDVLHYQLMNQMSFRTESSE